MADSTPISVTDNDVREPSLLLRALRKITGRVGTIEDRIGKLERSPQPLSPQEIKAQLQATGAAPLNLTALPGVAAQPQLAGAPRLNPAPTGLVLQQYQDMQLLLVGTTSTGFALNAVIGGNPTTLYQLISGLTTSGGNFMTLDTVQTSTGNKTIQGSWVYEASVALSTGAKISQYNGVTTTGEGIPYIIGRSVVTGGSTTTAAITLYTTTSSGEYRLNYHLSAGSTGTSAASLAYQYTDNLAIRTILSTTTAVNFTLTGIDQGVKLLHAISGTVISYQVTMGTSTVAPLGTFNVYALLERLS